MAAVTQPLTQKDKTLATDTLHGLYDTDNGGRKPNVRASIRDDLKGLVRLAGMDDREWDLLPLHDLVIIQRLAGLLVANAAEKTIVRLQQSQNESAFKEAR